MAVNLGSQRSPALGKKRARPTQNKKAADPKVDRLQFMERATGFEPATSTLARWRATNCAKPASARDNIREASALRKPKFQIRWKKFRGTEHHAERSAGNLREIAAWGPYLSALQYPRSASSPHPTLPQCPCLAQSPPLPAPQCSGTLRGGVMWAPGNYPTLRRWGDV